MKEEKKDYKPIALGFTPKYDAEDEKAFAEMDAEFIKGINRGNPENNEKIAKKD